MPISKVGLLVGVMRRGTEKGKQLQAAARLRMDERGDEHEKR